MTPWLSPAAVAELTGRVRFVLPLPDPQDREFTHTPGRQTRRSESKRAEAWEQACRQAWRALALVVKAKLEAIEGGSIYTGPEFGCVHFTTAPPAPPTLCRSKSPPAS